MKSSHLQGKTKELHNAEQQWTFQEKEMKDIIFLLNLQERSLVKQDAIT